MPARRGCAQGVTPIYPVETNSSIKGMMVCGVKSVTDEADSYCKRREGPVMVRLSRDRTPVQLRPGPVGHADQADRRVGCDTNAVRQAAAKRGK